MTTSHFMTDMRTTHACTYHHVFDKQGQHMRMQEVPGYEDEYDMT